MKKLLALVAIAGLSFSLVGCGDKPKPKPPAETPKAPAEGGATDAPKT